MNPNNLFETCFDKKNAQIVVAINLIPGSCLEYNAKIKNKNIVLQSNLLSSDRFNGLQINLQTKSYIPLLRLPEGYRFFSFEGVENVKFSIIHNKNINNFLFDVDQENYKFNNIRLTLDFRVITESLCAIWSNGVLYVRESNISIIERHGTYDDFLMVVNKLKNQRIQNFI